jgi:hypothetical protein
MAATGGKLPLPEWLARRLLCPELKVLLRLRRDIADWAVFWSAVCVDELDFSIAFTGD